MKHTIFAGALALSLATAAPAVAQNREHVQMAAELRMLQEQQAQLALSIAQLAQTIADSMKQLNARLDQTNENLRKGFADSNLAIRQMGDDVRVIREGTQTTATQIGRLREELEALRTSLPSMLTRLQPAPPVDPLAPVDPNAPPVAPFVPPVDVAPPASTVGLSPDRLFSTASSDYASGQFSLAIGGFEQYIRAFPNTDRADDAQQAIGDAEAAQMRFEEAIAAYNRVIQNYPREDQVPWAYYKRALVQRRLERTDEARASLEMAIKTAPGPESQVAVLANQVLGGLTRTPATPPK